MIVESAKINCDNINDWASFHSEFNRVFGFPDFYGNNMNAWIDCMSSIDSQDDGMTSIHCKEGAVLTIELDNVRVLKKKHPDLYEAVLEAVAFVNWRRMDVGEKSVLALAFYA